MERTGFTWSAKVLGNLIPVVFGLLGAILGNLPISFFGGVVPSPLLALMPVYFWCLVRPDRMSPGWAFLIGVIQDVLSGGPPGIWAASFVLTYAMVDRQRDAFAGLSGFGAVLGFATAALVACGAAYIIACVYFWHMMPLAPIMSELAITVLFYIPVAALFGPVHRRFVGPLRSEF